MADYYMVLLSENDKPILESARASVALKALGFPTSLLQDEDGGVWTVEFNAQQAEKLESAGHLEVSNGAFSLEAEMP